jgi:hypothetical protein
MSMSAEAVLAVLDALDDTRVEARTAAAGTV